MPSDAEISPQLYEFVIKIIEENTWNKSKGLR